MTVVDLALFGPPILIGGGAWLAIWLSERSLQAQRVTEQRRRSAAE